MIMHICVGTRDLEKAGKFYDAITAELGVGRNATTERTIYYGSSGNGIGFAVTIPYDGNPATFGNGTMATLAAADRAQVDRLHDEQAGNSATICDTFDRFRHKPATGPA